MSIEYLIEMDCPVKQKLSPGGMKWWIMAKAQAEHVMEVEIRNGKSEEEARQTTFKYHLMGNDRSEATIDGKVGDFLDQARGLDEMRVHCVGCMASLGSPFGCYGRINYPISAEGERWLAEAARTSFNRGGPYSLVVDTILDERPSGRPFTDMRKNPNVTFLERKDPVRVSVGKGIFGKKEINTDQLLFTLFPAERITKNYALALARLSGGLKAQKDEPPEGTYESATSMTDDAGNTEWWVFASDYPENEDRSVRQLKSYLSSCFRAFIIDKSISIDM